MKTKPVICYSRKRGAWVIYDRPLRFTAIQHANATHGTSFDPVERQNVTGGLPMAWACRPQEFASEGEAAMAASRR